ncbi:putative prophage Mu, DNA transposition protein B [Sulfurovum sp. enrichment culture clone C5]|uniref:Putative prophage Mu, DNA transposition protein B n=1 Tax=Sulfurovum sp. enrichment culture clone C5 TaxID=497650 RepID=A0A0S4XLN0_9BACT|nr:putative prophage Mu, DNA transposition protein B [Sulfurovum sp. enrichment culture clone C5]
MKEGFIETRNYTKIFESFTRLEALPITAPKIGLGYGNFGLGKTFSLERIAAKKNAILLRAEPTWSKKKLLEKLCTELGLDITGGGGRMYDRIVEDLRREKRIIIIDEIDILIENDKNTLTELLRAIHDETTSIFYFIGMEGALGIFKRKRHYFSRIVELVEFKAIGVDDVKKFCEKCDVNIEDDLVGYFAERYPNLRQILVLLVRLEKECLINDITSVSLATFNEMGVEHARK